MCSSDLHFHALWIWFGRFSNTFSKKRKSNHKSQSQRLCVDNLQFIVQVSLLPIFSFHLFIFVFTIGLICMRASCSMVIQISPTNREWRIHLKITSAPCRVGRVGFFSFGLEGRINKFVPESKVVSCQLFPSLK